MIIVVVEKIDKYVLPTLGKGIGPSFSRVVWPFLLLGRVGVTVGLLGFEVGVGPSSLRLGLSSFVWFFFFIIQIKITQ